MAHSLRTRVFPKMKGIEAENGRKHAAYYGRVGYRLNKGKLTDKLLLSFYLKSMKY